MIIKRSTDSNHDMAPSMINPEAALQASQYP